MRRQPKFALLTTTCRRCGKAVTTGNRSLFGADAIKAQYDRICEACITPDERHAILQGQGAAIVEAALCR